MRTGRAQSVGWSRNPLAGRPDRWPGSRRPTTHHQKTTLARSPAIQTVSYPGFCAGCLINWRSGVSASRSKSWKR